MEPTTSTPPSLLPEWLERLQNESWQAEILISGGTFFGLLNFREFLLPLSDFLFYSTSIHERIVNAIVAGTGLASITLLVGFLIHLVLRGFWIGLVGMNYAFPNGIEKERLAMKGRFTSMFRETQNIPMIIKVDKVCGGIFAISFVLLFAYVGLVSYITVFAFLVNSVGQSNDIVKLSVALLAVLMGLLTLIDFIMGGRLKRVRWLSYVYYPMFKVMSILTLSFVYRRLYYTLVSNIPLRYLWLIFCVPILFMMSIGLANTLNSSLASYNDSRGGFDFSGSKDFISLRNEIVTENQLDVSLIHMVRLEKPAFDRWKKKHPAESATEFEALTSDVQLKLLNDLYQLEMDGKKVTDTTNWLASKYAHQDSFLRLPLIKLYRVVNISELEKGPHRLSVKINLDTTVIAHQVEFGGKYAEVGFYLNN